MRADQGLAASLAERGPLDPVLSALTDGRLVREVVAPRGGSVAVPAVPLGFGFTGAQLRVLDVTGSPEATEAVNAFVGRLRNRGIDVGDGPFTVYTLPPVREALEIAAAKGTDADDPLGSSLIVPAETAVEFVGAVFENGELYAKTTVSAGPAPVVAGTPRPRTFAGPSYSGHFERSGGVACMERKQNSTAHYDPCQWFYKLVDERDSRRDYWASEMYGTGKSHSFWRLSGLEVESRRTDGTPRQDWVDWDPGADAKTNCQAQSVSVSYAGASVGVEKQHCELWDIDKGGAAFDMSNWWKGDVWRSERETAAVVLTTLGEGQLPHGTFDFDYHAHP